MKDIIILFVNNLFTKSSTKFSKGDKQIKRSFVDHIYLKSFNKKICVKQNMKWNKLKVGITIYTKEKKISCKFNFSNNLTFF